MGLERGAVELVDHRPGWRRAYEREVDRLVPAVGDEVRTFEHVGSTAVPGLAAKPVVDLLAALEPDAAPADVRPTLEAHGYERRPDDGVAGREFFAKGPHADRTHYLSVTRCGSDVHVSQVAFRDYLRAHPDVAGAYESLKRELAEEYPDDRAAYTAEKGAFVEGVLERALAAGYGPDSKRTE